MQMVASYGIIWEISIRWQTLLAHHKFSSRLERTSLYKLFRPVYYTCWLQVKDMGFWAMLHGMKMGADFSNLIWQIYSLHCLHSAWIGWWIRKSMHNFQKLGVKPTDYFDRSLKTGVENGMIWSKIWSGYCSSPVFTFPWQSVIKRSRKFTASVFRNV